MYPILFQFGNFQIHTYGIVVAISFFIGLWLSTNEAKRKGLDPGVIQDFALYALLGGIIGARIYFVLFSNPAYFLQNPWEIVAVWRGGIGIIGAFLGGFLAALWYCRRKKISFWRFADTLAPGLALGQTMGMFACLLNGDSYGKPTDLPWAIIFTDPRAMAPLNIPLHPIEVYEIIAYFLVFLLVWLTRKMYRSEGFSFFTAVAGYGVARFSVEFFRGHSAIFAWDIPAAQVFSVALILTAMIAFFLLGNGVEEAKPSKKIKVKSRK